MICAGSHLRSAAQLVRHGSEHLEERTDAGDAHAEDVAGSQHEHGAAARHHLDTDVARRVGDRERVTDHEQIGEAPFGA